MTILGHHHISMYTKDVKQNKKFYTEVLGLRLVEISVNQDNPSMYHFFYGDEEGAPGTLLSFFEIPHSGHTRKGTNSIYRLSLLVEDAQTIDYFKSRLESYNIKTETLSYAGEEALLFEDYDELEIILIPNNGRPTPKVWKENSYSVIPNAHQILGMGPVELRVQDTQSTIDFLINTLGYKDKGHDHLYTLNADGLYTDFVVIQQDELSVRPGRGYVHHIAVEVPTEEDLIELMQKIDTLPGDHTDIIDRYFFKSLYYRQNTIMYEFATTQPGFMVDTPKEQLGKQLNLPSFMEADREEIEQRLTPLDL